MSNILKSDQPCPCGASDAFATYDDGSGYCFSSKCGQKYYSKVELNNVNNGSPNNHSNSSHSSSKKVKTLKDIPADGQHISYSDKGIAPTTLKTFGVTVYTKNGVPSLVKYPGYGSGSIVAANIKDIEAKDRRNAGDSTAPKAFKWYGDVSKVDTLFGAHLFPKGGKYITITEGQDDAMAGYQMFGSKYPFVSIIKGIGSAVKEIEEHFEYLNSFEHIVFCFDNDEHGRKRALECARKFPGKAKTVSLVRHKDAADYLKAGEVKEFVREWWAAPTYHPSGVIHGVDKILEVASLKPEKGIPLIWPGLNDITLGVRKNEIWTFGAGCLKPNTKVIMYDGSLKEARHVRVGDQLMGDDSLPRNVLDVATGTDTMYRVSSKNFSYEVNSQHILSLQYSASEKRWGYNLGDKMDIPIKEFLSKSKKFQRLFKGFRTGWNCGEPWPLPCVTPYAVGLWLGDGNTSSPVITNQDKEVVDYWCSFSNLRVQTTNKARCKSYRLNGGRGSQIIKDLKLFGLGSKKSIPEWVFSLDHNSRMELIAGLMDTDGNITGRGATLENTQKQHSVAYGLQRLCQSVGLKASLNIKHVKGYGDYYRVFVSGDIQDIPMLVKHKRGSNPGTINKALDTLTIEEIGTGDYCGFMVDGNHRFLLEDTSVTHNTGLGKSTCFKEIMFGLMRNERKKVGGIFLEEASSLTIQSLLAKEIGWRYYIDGSQEPTEEQIQQAAKELGDYLVLADGCTPDWTAVKEKIEYFVRGLGCEYIFLDHITAIAEGKDQDVNSYIHMIMEEMRSMLSVDSFSIFMISHLNQNSPKPHEEGGRVRLNNFYGSGAIKQWSNYVFGLEGDQQAEDPEERNQRYLRCLKDRQIGTGVGSVIPLFYDHKTGRLNELCDKSSKDYDELLKHADI